MAPRKWFLEDIAASTGSTLMAHHNHHLRLLAATANYSESVSSSIATHNYTGGSPVPASGGTMGSNHPMFGIILIVMLLIFFLMFFFSVYIRRSSCISGEDADRQLYYNYMEGQYVAAAMAMEGRPPQGMGSGLDPETIAKLLPIVKFDSSKVPSNMPKGGAMASSDMPKGGAVASSDMPGMCVEEEAKVRDEEEEEEGMRGMGTLPGAMVRASIYGAGPGECGDVPVPVPISVHGDHHHHHHHQALLLQADQCAVCLMEFEEEEAVRLLPNCNHCFHPGCIDMWLFSHFTCPICRRNAVHLVQLAGADKDPVPMPPAPMHPPGVNAAAGTGGLVVVGEIVVPRLPRDVVISIDGIMDLGRDHNGNERALENLNSDPGLFADRVDRIGNARITTRPHQEALVNE